MSPAVGRAPFIFGGALMHCPSDFGSARPRGGEVREVSLSAAAGPISRAFFAGCRRVLPPPPPLPPAPAPPRPARPSAPARPPEGGRAPPRAAPFRACSRARVCTALSPPWLLRLLASELVSDSESSRRRRCRWMVTFCCKSSWRSSRCRCTSACRSGSSSAKYLAVLCAVRTLKGAAWGSRWCPASHLCNISQAPRRPRPTSQ